MNLKKTAKVGMIIAASAALVATLINDKKNKEQSVDNVETQQD